MASARRPAGPARGKGHPRTLEPCRPAEARSSGAGRSFPPFRLRRSGGRVFAPPRDDRREAVTYADRLSAALSEHEKELARQPSRRSFAGGSALTEVSVGVSMASSPKLGNVKQERFGLQSWT